MSFRKRLTYSFFLLAIIVVSFQFGSFYKASYDVVFHKIQQRLDAIARSSSLLVSHDLHEKMIDPSQEVSASYQEAIAPLAALHRELPKIKYIYTIKKIDNRYYFILDPTIEGDHDGDGVDDKSHIMQEYDDIDPVTSALIDRVLTSGEAAVQDEVTTDQWGTFLSSFAPLKSPTGETYGVIGVDLEVSELDKNLAAFRRSSIYSLFFGLLAAIVFSAIIASYHRKVLSRFEQAIEELGSDQAPSLPLKEGNDEFGRIAKTVYRMRDVIFSQKQILRDQIVQLERRSIETRLAHQKTMEALSALKDTQSALVQSQKLAALGQLGAGLAHELNSPLAAMLEMSRQLLDETPKDHPDYELFREMKTACEHMAKIVKGVSIFSRHAPSEYSPSDVGQVIDNTLILINHRLKKEGIKIEKHVPDDIPLVLGNPPKLQEVLLNLCVNACDAMEVSSEKRLTIAVSILEREDGKWVKIVISDTGMGIPRHVIDAIFDPFFTTKPIGKGTGLGLSICYGIIKDHNGTITVESIPGHSTTFRILLPVYRGEEVRSA